jgi:hypothetical protein
MKYSIILIIILAGVRLNSQNPDLACTAVRTLNSPKIDGFIQDDTWDAAIMITEFYQREPYYNTQPSQKTVVKILYDNNAIYIAAMLYDTKPDSIFKDLGPRDDQSITADKFYIGFDTYNRFDAYVFGVSSSGVQFDYRDSDPTFDAVWQSSTLISDSGWSVEMKIPYSAIRFPSEDKQEWGFQLIRTITRSNEYIQWAVTPRTIANSRTLWGKLKGMEQIRPPVRLSVTPFVNLFYQNEQISISDGSKYNAMSYNFGADIKYGIDERYTIDMTLLPDFSQVQSDNKIKNLSYNEVVFNENRPFFKEGTELFSKNQLFYSRRIGKTPDKYYLVPYVLQEGEQVLENPSATKLLNAVKLSGRNNQGLGIGVLNAITDNTYAIVKDSAGNTRKILTEPLSNYNVIVFDQQLKYNSSLYFINTNVLRPDENNVANVTGSGFTLMNKKNSFATDGNIAFSQKYSGNDSIKNLFTTQTGHRYFIGVRKASGNFQFGVSHTFINKTYDSRDLGYYVIGNKQSEKIYFTYNSFEQKKIFRELYNSLSFTYTTNPETHKTVNNLLNIDLNRVFQNYALINAGLSLMPLISYDYYEPRVPGRFSRIYRYYYFYGSYSSDNRKKLSLTIPVNFGNFTERFEGTAFGINPGLRYRISNSLQVNYSFRYDLDNYNLGFVDIIGADSIIFGGRKLKTYENTVSVQYVISKDITILLYGRHYWYTGKYLHYYNLPENGIVELNQTYNQNNDFSYNIFNIDLMFSWQFAPGSMLSLVFKKAIEDEAELTDAGFYENFKYTFNQPQSTSISLKMLYYLDYSYLKKII